MISFSLQKVMSKLDEVNDRQKSTSQENSHSGFYLGDLNAAVRRWNCSLSYKIKPLAVPTRSPDLPMVSAR